LRSPDPSLEKEAIRVVKSMPKWVPGKQNGVSVPVYFTLPVTFRLQ
ncbi:MAG: energy transducer TonB, partial [Bacteroidaceae bacterium]|nr:energy transducer TonB [Bacteroidaceae bacterium]